MDRDKKIQYQHDVEKYLEENKVYELFEDLMKNLIIAKPENPLDFLIHKLSEPQQKRVFIVGPPGSKTRELALALGEYLKYNCISVGDLLKKEISKKSQLGQQIEQAVEKFEFVPDDIVVQIVTNYINQMEREKDNYILEGYPKTRAQGLAFQKAGIIPDSFIILNMEDQTIEESCLKKINNGDGYYSQKYSQEERVALAKAHSIEYRLNLRQIKQIYNKFFFQVDAEHANQKFEDILQDMARLLNYKIQSHSPKRAQKVIILGPPGSGRTSLSKRLSQKYNLVFVSTKELISDYISNKSDGGQYAQSQINRGELVDDEIVSQLVKARINQTDCKVQGFVLAGYPKTLNQLKHLEEFRLSPSLIVVLECSDQVAIERLTKRKVDPYTGIVYTNFKEVRDPEIQRRLVSNPNETMEVVKKRIHRWKELLKSMEQIEMYSAVIFKVPATLSELNVFEKVADHLEKYN